MLRWTDGWLDDVEMGRCRWTVGPGEGGGERERDGNGIIWYLGDNGGKG